MLPSPPKTFFAKLAAFDPHALLALVQDQVDLALRMPAWLAWTLLAASLLWVALGRHALRPLSGLGVGGIVALLSLRLLKPVLDPGSILPGLFAILGTGGGLALGLALPGTALGLCFAAPTGWAGGAFAVYFADANFYFGAVPFALLGFFFGLANHQRLASVLPPIASALFAVAAGARLLAPTSAGAILPELGQAHWTMFAFGGLSIALLGLSWQREHVRRRRLERNKTVMDDQALRDKVKRDKERFEKFLGKSAHTTGKPENGK